MPGESYKTQCFLKFQTLHFNWISLILGSDGEKCKKNSFDARTSTAIQLLQKVLLAPSGPLRGESAQSLVFTIVLVTDVLLQLDHVSETTFLPVCEKRKSVAHSEDN